MRRVLVVGLVLVSSALFFLNCAALFNSGGGEAAFNSNPSGADVIVDGQSLGKTPVTLQLDRTKTHQIAIRKDGKEKSYVLDKKVGATWIILDVLAGFVPIVIDAATGSWYSLSPNQVNAQLE